MTEAAVGRVFAALADPTRRAVVLELGRRATVTATELAEQHPMTRQALAKHLGVLEQAGLVEHARQGRETRYALRPEPLTEAAGWLVQAGAAWDERLARLGRLAAARAADS
jgi:DNA-binding transcriptional ArsR family regulator